MWAFMLMICTGPEVVCVPNWSDTSVFKTEEHCKTVAKESLLLGLAHFDSQGKDILFVDGQCIYFDYVIPEGEDT